MATLSVFILWTWSVYSNFFSSFYLDPASVFFGFYFLYLLGRALGFGGEPHSCTRRYLWAAGAGLSLALSFLFKGLTGLAFGLPAAALVLAALGRSYSQLRLRETLQRSLIVVAVCLGVTALCGWAYFASLQGSTVPDFLERYWQRQISNRFGNSWEWSGVFNSAFWQRLLKDSHYLLLVMPVAFWRLPKKGFWMWLAFSWMSFVFLYAPAQRIGSQYWILIFPPMALFVAALFQSWKSFSPQAFQRVTLAIAVSLVIVVQYLPFPTHHPRNPVETSAIRELQKHLPESDLIIAGDFNVTNFIYAAPFAWYADTRVHYLSLETLKNKSLAGIQLFKGPLDKAGIPSHSVLLQHTLWEGQENFPCQHNARLDGTELQWQLYRDFGGTAVYAPLGTAPEIPARCMNSKI